jgi:putative OPT family oligopeptide transporter
MTSIPAPRQLTVRAVALAIILAMILAAANTYLGLFAGLTIASAIPAAVVSMAVLRVLGGGTILENNIVQTGASAGSSIASGVIFTIPALVILGHWVDFQYLWVLAIAGLGGILGVFFSVPLRRALRARPQPRCSRPVRTRAPASGFWGSQRSAAASPSSRPAVACG